MRIRNVLAGVLLVTSCLSAVAQKHVHIAETEGVSLDADVQGDMITLKCDNSSSQSVRCTVTNITLWVDGTKKAHWDGPYAMSVNSGQESSMTLSGNFPIVTGEVEIRATLNVQ
jgi:hypothetical protein